ncbi:MAG: thiamine phosphate synthase [Oscillospiraceae bacterium]|nr:thiamine phosphate synthase [Oscillospiraceae bacterium]
MSDILCVTNRKLCREDFLARIQQIAVCHPAGIILREKDMQLEDYKELAVTVKTICGRYGVRCILHSFPDVAISLQADAIHLPLHLLRAMPREQKAHFKVLGASCHSVQDALEAQALGCTYITAGHVFETDCKKGLPGRGLDFLRNVCAAVDIPVYGIGGIDAANIALVRNAGAKGACLMSSLMQSDDVPGLLKSMEE